MLASMEGGQEVWGGGKGAGLLCSVVTMTVGPSAGRAVE